MRVVCLRIGLVLGTEGGFITRMLTPFEFGLGGPLGSGRQWMSWIERDDLVRLIAHVIATPRYRRPDQRHRADPVTNTRFTQELARRLHRPALFRIPDALLRGFGGDFASELLLGGQRVLPNKALSDGFVVSSPDPAQRVRGDPVRQAMVSTTWSRAMEGWVAGCAAATGVVSMLHGGHYSLCGERVRQPSVFRQSSGVHHLGLRLLRSMLRKLLIFLVTC